MPFDYDEYSKKCSTMSESELQKEWENYTRQLSGGATSTTLSVGFAHLTLGASLVGLGLSAPRIHNARKKRAIVEERLRQLEMEARTRKRDVLGPVALRRLQQTAYAGDINYRMSQEYIIQRNSTIGALTLGLAPLGAHEVSTMGVDHAINCIAANPHMVDGVTHVALDGVGATVEEGLDKRTEKREKKKMEKAQEAMLGHFKRWKAEQEAIEAKVGIDDVKSSQDFCPQALVRSYTLRDADPPAYEDVARPPLPPRRTAEDSKSEKVVVPDKSKIVENIEGDESSEKHPELTAEDLRVIFECKVWKEVKDSENAATKHDESLHSTTSTAH